MTERRALIFFSLVAAVSLGVALVRVASARVGLTHSEFVAIGQTSTPGGGTGGGTGSTGGTGGGAGSTGGSGTVTSVRVVPQIAVGSLEGSGLYSTIIQVVNSGTSAVMIQGDFYKADGTASTITFSTNMNSIAGFTGTLAPLSLPANAVLVLTADSTAAFASGWGRLTSDGSLTVSTVFEIREPTTKALLSRVGVAPSPADMARFVVPRIRNVANGLDVGFAVVNTGSSSATIVATLIGANGQTIGSRALNMVARSQSAQFVREFFGLQNEASGTSFSFVVFDSTASQFAAVGLAFEGSTQTSFPVDRIR